MKLKKLISILLCVACIAGATALSSCRGKDDGTTTDGKSKISFWYWGSNAEVKVYKALIAQYQEENTNVIISPKHYESNIYMNNFMNETTKPDVFFMPDTDFLQWADAGIMEDLSPYCSKDELASVWSAAIDEYYYNPSSYTLGYSEGAKLYGLPKDLGPVTLVYNKTLLDSQIKKNGLSSSEVYALLDAQTPMSWAQFSGLLVDLTKDQNKSDVNRIYGIPYYEMDTAVYSNNANYFYDNATTQGIDQNFIDAVTYNIQLATVHHVMPDADFSGTTDAYTLFLSNKCIFTWMGPWDNADFWDYKDLKYEIIPVPYGTAEGAESVSFIGSMCYGVSQKSKVKDEAAKFVKWLSMSKSCQQKSMELGQQVPNIVSMTKDYVSSEWKVQPENRSVFIDIIDQHTDSLGIYASQQKTDKVSGKTRALYYTYGSTWRDNLLSYLNDKDAWKKSSAEDIKNILLDYKGRLQKDLDDMNREFKG